MKLLVGGPGLCCGDRCSASTIHAASRVGLILWSLIGVVGLQRSFADMLIMQGRTDTHEIVVADVVTPFIFSSTAC
jgi:hypothetical protein